MKIKETNHKEQYKLHNSCVIIFIFELKKFSECRCEFRAYLPGLVVGDAPLGDGRLATARNDGLVTFAGDSRQGGDAVENGKTDSHSVQITTCNSNQIGEFY